MRIGELPHRSSECRVERLWRFSRSRVRKANVQNKLDGIGWKIGGAYEIVNRASGPDADQRLNPLFRLTLCPKSLVKPRSFMVPPVVACGRRD